MYVTRDTMELRELLNNLRKTKENALCFASFQKKSINDLLMEGLFIKGENFDINQIDINYDDAINDILKKINWETKDEQVYQSLAIVYMPNENANKIFSEFDESNQEDDYGIDIDNKFVYAYVDLIDMQIRYNYDCVFFADERSL